MALWLQHCPFVVNLLVNIFRAWETDQSVLRVPEVHTPGSPRSTSVQRVAGTQKPTCPLIPTYPTLAPNPFVSILTLQSTI